MAVDAQKMVDDLRCWKSISLTQRFGPACVLIYALQPVVLDTAMYAALELFR